MSGATRGQGRGPAGVADVCVGLGANVGDRHLSLKKAVIALDGMEGVDVDAVSAVYETEAHIRPGTAPQADHLNAAARLSTTLAPLDLLARLHALERAAGRDPAAAPWSPRPLDLDVLLWNDDVLDLPGLAVPHPRLAERRFVLAPLADLVPDRIVPGTGRTVADLLGSTTDRARIVRTGWSLVPPAA